jgi:hypothetical protein
MRQGVRRISASATTRKIRGTNWAAHPHTSQSGRRATFQVFRMPGECGPEQASQRDGGPDGAMRTMIFLNGMLAMDGSNVTTQGEYTWASSTLRLGNN